MKFTKTEIDLCRQVAEKHRKEIEYGDWYINIEQAKKGPCFQGIGVWMGFEPVSFRKKDIIPLWTIEDCLEFLRKRKLRFTLYACELNKYSMSIIDDKNTIIEEVEGKTPLEALLKAVLAVLDDK